jgi:hypothetical protein
LRSQDPGDVHGICRVQGRVLRRAYLGEYWDYHVSLPGSAQPLRVTARAQDVFEVDAPVWALIDTTQLTVIRPD